MHKPPFYPALFLAGLLLFAVVLLAYFPITHLVKSLQEDLVERLGDAMQQRVRLEIGGARLGFRHGLGFRMYDVSLRETGATREPIFQAKYLFIALDPWALLRGNMRIKRIYAFQPRVVLVRDRSGNLNVAGLFSAAYGKQETRVDVPGESLLETFGPLLWRDTISFKSGEILYRHAAAKDPVSLRVIKVDLEVNNRLTSDQLDIRLSGEVDSPAIRSRLELNGSVRG